MTKIRQTNFHLLPLAFLFLLQIGFINCYLPLSEWFTPNPIYTDDYSFHYADALYKKIYLGKSTMACGYNPFIRAGSANNAILTVDNNGWGLFVFLTSFLPPGLSFKLFFIIAVLSIPFLLFYSALNFKLSRSESIICSVIGMIFLHTSICVDFLYWGTVSYIFSAYLCLFIVSLFYRFVERGKIFHIVSVTILFAMGFWVHIYTAFHLMVPFAACYLFYFRQLSLKAHGLIIASMMAVALLNVPWLYPFLSLQDTINTDQPHFIYVTSNVLEPLKTYFFLDIKFNEYMNIPFLKSGLVDVMLMGLGIIGLVRWKKEGETFKVFLFVASIIFFFLLAYYGSFLNFTANLLPLRFVIVMNIFLTVPASLGITELYRLFFTDKSFKIKYISLAVVFYLTGTLLSNPYYHLFLKKDFRLITSIPQPIEELIQWSIDTTTPAGRILIESSDFDTNHQYYGTHLPYVMPLITNREYIGNYAYYPVCLDNFTSFTSYRLFEKPIEYYTPANLKPYLDLYNIKWVIVWSEASKKLFQSSPSYFIFKKRIDKFFIFEINRVPSFFLKGKGAKKAELNKIELKNVKPEDGEIILSYHWMKYLKTDPPRKLERTFFLDDPVGFIKVIDPPSSLVIYNRYY